MTPGNLATWTGEELIAARDELERDYWSSGPQQRVKLNKLMMDIDDEMLRRRDEIELIDRLSADEQEWHEFNQMKGTG
jgi:hypothetical protein